MDRFSDLTMQDIEIIEGHFAVLTDTGWTIPSWVVELRKAIQLKEDQPLVMEN